MLKKISICAVLAMAVMAGGVQAEQVGNTPYAITKTTASVPGCTNENAYIVEKDPNIVDARFMPGTTCGMEVIHKKDAPVYDRPYHVVVKVTGYIGIGEFVLKR